MIELTMQDRGESSNQVRGFVDRIEGDIAIVIISDELSTQIDMPARLLPAGIRPGDHLIIGFNIDPQATDETARNVSELRRQLTMDSDQQGSNFKL
ncbi:MAG: DUF3006 domain-containing protein [Acidobacteria bacterium]|nr:DUF3006 domain-containing protein [Acidobacteriota bacterium]